MRGLPAWNFLMTFPVMPIIVGLMKNTPSSTVYLSNLSYERDRNGIKSLLRSFGKIINIKIIVEPKTNQSRGMAFIEMETVEDATKVIKELNGKIIDGRTLKANFAIPQKEERFFYPAKVEKKEAPKKKKEKDLDYVSTQLAKKARNDAKRKSNPLQFKVAAKKKTKSS